MVRYDADEANPRDQRPYKAERKDRGARGL